MEKSESAPTVSAPGSSSPPVDDARLWDDLEDALGPKGHDWRLSRNTNLPNDVGTYRIQAVCSKCRVLEVAEFSSTAVASTGMHPKRWVQALEDSLLRRMRMIDARQPCPKPF